MNPQLTLLLHEFSKLKTKKELEIFLLAILTPSEIHAFAQRIEIVKMLKKQVPQHEVAKQLGVGVATVTRGAKELQKGRFTTL